MATMPRVLAKSLTSLNLDHDQTLYSFRLYR